MTQEAKPPVPSPARLLVAGCAALVAAYIFGSIAFDRGNYWYYALTLVSLYLGAHYFFKALKQRKKHHE